MSKIRLGIIGCGGNSSGHARRMNENPDVQIVGTCDVNTDIANSYIDRNLPELDPRPAAFDNIPAMLDETVPDAALISTPHTLHFEHGMHALNADCHVLVEKPMVTAAQDAYTIAEKVKETGKVFTIGYNTPCSANFYYVRECIRNQTLGKLELVTGYITQNWLHATKGSGGRSPSCLVAGKRMTAGRICSTACAGLLNPTLLKSIPSLIMSERRLISTVQPTSGLKTGFSRVLSSAVTAQVPAVPTWLSSLKTAESKLTVGVAVGFVSTKVGNNLTRRRLLRRCRRVRQTTTSSMLFLVVLNRAPAR